MCVGPKRVTTGRPNAAAKWRGPLSVVTSRSQRRTSALVKPSEGVGQQRRTSVACVTCAALAPAQPGGESGAKRGGEEDGEIDPPAPQRPLRRPDTFREDQFVEPVAAREDAGDVGLGDAGDAG